MKSLKALIVSDELYLAQELQKRLADLPSVTISCCTIEEAMKVIAEFQPDVTFVKLNSIRKKIEAIKSMPKDYKMPIVFLPSSSKSIDEESRMIESLVRDLQEQT